MSAPHVDALHVGWRELHSDVSLNFQINRWAAYGGERWLADVRPVVARLTDYSAWRDTFVALGETALRENRTLDAALHLRAAEFFMTARDPRKQPTRRRLLELLRSATGVDESARREVALDSLRLPAWHFPADPSRGTLVVFGGFDSYIEEFFPILLRLRDEGWNVIGFEGPGQGSVLEDQHAPMTPDWHHPVGAVLDAFGLDDVTLVGISLGGCLAVRAAAREPRVRRVVAYDALTDFYAVILAQRPPIAGALVRGLQAVRASTLLDRSVRALARRSPVVAWGIEQAMHVLGCESPHQALAAARGFQTADISHLVTQDVLLLAGARDHYVPLEQIWEQGRMLTNARSITTRVFSVEEHAQAHCQVGNLPLVLDVIASWVQQSARATR